MAVVSIKNKLRRGNLLVGNEAFDPGGMVPIATTVVSSGGATSIEFTSIPSTYTHLQLRVFARSTIAASSSDGIYVQYNGSTSGIYTLHRIVGNGSSVTTNVATNNTETYIDRITGGNSPANTFGSIVTDILDYGNTNKYKTHRYFGGWDSNGDGYITLGSGLWQSTNAITSIKLFLFSNGFAQYTHAALYGIKSA